DCEATRIPSGASVVLPVGTRVTITQTLGGNFTVSTEDGALLRIADKDADALGERAPAAAAPAPMVEGPFEEERVWEQLRTVFDPEIPVNLVDLGLIYRCQAGLQLGEADAAPVASDVRAVTHLELLLGASVRGDRHHLLVLIDGSDLARELRLAGRAGGRSRL